MANHKWIVGVDPGQTGAFAFVRDDGEGSQVFDMPIVKVGKKTEISPAGIVNLLKRHIAILDHVYIEKVSTRPGQGVASSGAFMRGFGQIEGVIAALGVPYTLVIPQRWKKAMLSDMAKDNKDSSRQRALQLFPRRADDLKRKKDDGRAEALLIAEYGRRLGQGR